MAASRLERIGSIYSRVKGLIRAGSMKPDDKPLWYDVYEAFPPKIEPVFGRKDPDFPIRPIFYQEDVIRAKFYERFGSPGVVSLLNPKAISPCQRFVDKYQEMEKDYSNEDELFEAVIKALETQEALIQEEKAASDASPSENPSMVSTFKEAMAQSKQDKSKKSLNVDFKGLLSENDEKK